MERCDVLVVGADGAVSPLTAGGLDACLRLSPCRDPPQRDKLPP